MWHKIFPQVYLFREKYKINILSELGSAAHFDPQFTLTCSDYFLGIQITEFCVFICGMYISNIIRPGKIDGYSTNFNKFIARHFWSSVTMRWGDGTSRNDVSQYEFSCTPGPQNVAYKKHNVPALINSCYCALYNTYV